MISRLIAFASLALASAVPAAAQTDSMPTPGLLRARKLTSAEARNAVLQARSDTVAQLRLMGGKFAQEAKKLETLGPSVFLERMAIAPPVGPSTIAPVKPGATPPTPSVNTYKGNGATTAHPGVALLLAREDGNDLYRAACSGTLIRQNVVLTAAHCMCYSFYPQDNPANGDECVNGAPNKPKSPMVKPDRWKVFFQHAGLRDVTRIIINERYTFSGTAIRDDLALLVLDKPVTEIDPPAFPEAVEAVTSFGPGEVVGYGYSAVQGSNGLALPQLLQAGIKGVGRVTSGLCSGLTYLEPAASLCSTYMPTQSGSTATVCEGDSGGPLWQPTAASTEIGVTSGISTADCTIVPTIGFQMATSFRRHNTWIVEQLKSVPGTNVKGILPAFGDNLIPVADRRNIGSFNEAGNYTSGPITSEAQSRILATMNSSGNIENFSVVEVGGKVLCKGAAGLGANLPNVNFCWATVNAGTKYQVMAKGEGSQFLQYVVSLRPTGK
jgi:hypothetical protein